jgi:chromosome segregation ATPase
MYVQDASLARQEYQQALDDLDASKENLSQCIDNLRTLESQKSRCEETFESERKTHEAKLALRLREAEAIETSVSSINDPVLLEEQMAKYERQIAELEAMRLQQQEENLAMKKAVEDEIEAACQAVMEMQNFCKAKAAEVSQYWMMKRTMNSTTVTTSENIDEENS